MVDDHVIRQNSGPMRLSVSGGGAVVEPCRGAMAAVLTGCLPAREAQRAGTMHDAAPGDIETLEAIFAGPRPWMMDIF